jgi:thioredoxin-related protein/YHS domain-containing protein
MRLWSLICGIVITSSAAPCLAQHGGWKADYAEAATAAEKDGLPILLHFHAWYCGPCQRMDRDVFPHADVQQALSTGLASIEIDVTKEPDLAARFDASTVPRDVVVFADGTVETLNIGYMSRSSYVSLLRDTAERGKTKRKPQKEKEEEQKKNDEPVPKPVDPSTSKSSNEPSITDNSSKPTEPDTDNAEPQDRALITGLNGYCPVRLHDARQWTPGLDSIVADYRDIRYRFSSEADREKFLKNPAEYAPQDLGCDPIVLTKEGKAVAGDIQYGAFFDQRLYLFKSAENREQFKKSPLLFIEIRSALKADQIQDTRRQ